MDLNKIIMSFMSKMEKDKKNYHDKRLLNIPDIIDPKTDKKLWDNVYNILYIYLDMVQEWTMSDKELELYIVDSIFHYDEIRRLCDDAAKNMLICIYIHTQYENLLEWCIQNEYYEGAYNLKKLDELL
jgi:hypothetical protein